MKLPAPLLPGNLVRRYQRFFAEIELADGSRVIAHTANTGSMRECAIPGFEVLLSRSTDPRRKLAYSLELIRVNDHWVDINTQRANRVVEEGLHAGSLAGLSGYAVRPEVPWGESRLDFLLTRGTEQVLVEVKNVTLTDGAGTACFPDAVTMRGQRHLRELLRARREGLRAVILFLVQRGEAAAFRPADHIDPQYGQLLRQSLAGGVEVLAYRTVVTQEENLLGERIPVSF